MNTTIKLALLTLGVAAAFSPAEAAVRTHFEYSSAVNYCQAFTPGVTDTIRNRAIGSQNVGPIPITVSCNFASYENGAPGGTALTGIMLMLANDSSAAASVTCTLLVGQWTGTSGSPIYTAAKSVAVPAGGVARVGWTTADNPEPGAHDLGDLMVGTNCTLPPGMILTAALSEWEAENGF